MAYPTPATSGAGLTGVWTPFGSGRIPLISGGRRLFLGGAQEANFRSLVGFLPFRSSRPCSLRVSIGSEPLSSFNLCGLNTFRVGGFSYGVSTGVLLGPPVTPFFLTCLQLLDVLNAHFQQVFGITKLQSTMLQLAYFVRNRDCIY